MIIECSATVVPARCWPKREQPCSMKATIEEDGMHWCRVHAPSAVRAREQEKAARDPLTRITAERDALAAEVRRLASRVAWYQERLEIDRVWKLSPDGGSMTEVEVPAEERDRMPDGIDCRDETIKLQDRAVGELRAEVGRLREALIDAARTLAYEESRLDSLREHSELDESTDLELAMSSGALGALLRAARSLVEAPR